MMWKRWTKKKKRQQTPAQPLQPLLNLTRDHATWILPPLQGPIGVIVSGTDRPSEVLVSLQWNHPELERLELPIPLPLAKQLLAYLQQSMVQIDKQISDRLDRKR